MPGEVKISGKEVAKHNNRESCWIIVHDKVYDVTEFLDEHPGGSKIILKYAGKDATQEYDPIHPPDAITTHLPRQKQSTATALGKLGHPDGELNLTRAAAKHGVIQMIPTLASCSFDELLDAAQPNQVQFLQLYVNKDREVTKRIVQHAEKRGIKGLFITVDAPQLGRREKDMRMKFEAEDPSEVKKTGSDNVDRSQGAARAISSFIDPGLNWNDMDWFKSITNMPLILKGVQRWEDALKAYDLGLAGVVLSNHGGRQLDFARSGLEVLVEVVRELGKRRGLKFPNEKFQLFVDGGVRRATDVIKAVALGATAVGIGRPFLYAFSSYGQEGVEHALQILKDEFEMNLRLIGATTIKDVTREVVDCTNLSSHVVAVPGDRLYDTNYESMQIATLKDIKAKL
ncbi:hypothetical protein MD484_g1833, partial [Candolleomyces efflorescens]